MMGVPHSRCRSRQINQVHQMPAQQITKRVGVVGKNNLRIL